MMNTAAHESLIEAAFRRLVEATSVPDRRAAVAQLLELIRQRNAQRTPQEIERLERERGLRA